MQVWLRLLVVWFIAIALPVQGVAGVTMAHCGSSHGRMGAAAQVAAHQPADPAEHGAGVAHPHPHHHGGDASHGAEAADHATLAQDPVKADKSSDLAQYKCSACASCCAGSALPSAMPRIPQVAAAPAVFTEAVVSVDAFASDGPDRPPRSCLV